MTDHDFEYLVLDAEGLPQRDVSEKWRTAGIIEFDRQGNLLQPDIRLRPGDSLVRRYVGPSETVIARGPDQLTLPTG